MPTERYTIGPKLLGDIRQTITRVDAIAPRTSGPHQEPRLQTLYRAPSPVRIGTFTPPWNKGSTAAVTLLAGGGTVEASNLFATVATTSTATTSLHCAVAMDGTTRYLIAAECDE